MQIPEHGAVARDAMSVGGRDGQRDPGRLREECANSLCGRAVQTVGTGVHVHRA